MSVDPASMAMALQGMQARNMPMIPQGAILDETYDMPTGTDPDYPMPSNGSPMHGMGMADGLFGVPPHELQRLAGDVVPLRMDPNPRPNTGISRDAPQIFFGSRPPPSGVTPISPAPEWTSEFLNRLRQRGE